MRCEECRHAVPGFAKVSKQDQKKTEQHTDSTTLNYEMYYSR